MLFVLCTNVTTLHMKNALVFSQSEACNFLVYYQLLNLVMHFFYYTQQLCVNASAGNLAVCWLPEQRRKIFSFDSSHTICFFDFYLLAVLFIKAFFKTMQREWHGIDRLRLDKFYMVSF